MLVEFLKRPLGWLVCALVLAGAAWWIVSAITAKPKAEARLGRNTSVAAQQSGRDAVNTVGSAAAREAASADLTRSNEKEIRDAEGADAPVAAPVRDAGLAGLCRRASYQRDPRCVQHADPR